MYRERQSKIFCCVGPSLGDQNSSITLAAARVGGGAGASIGP
jgi:hypothetical protein